MIKIDKIKLNNFRFFVNDEEHSSFELNGNNMLVYGENGSGKSSLYKAFELLAKINIDIDEFNENINIFKSQNTYIEFEFDNDKPSLRIDSDELSLENHDDFVKTLSVSKPMIEYKTLLNISYSINKEGKKNLYSFFEKILEDYPIDISDKKLLKELEDMEYFSTFKNIIQVELFDDINLFLERFNQNFKITKIDLKGIDRKAYLEIDYFDKQLENYHTFLNEARLSALAISIYFSIIKKQFSYLGEDSLKILVLDDLLISLDMNNRLHLLNILKSEFSDFQIFFFTHDKALFDIFKDKMSWKSYEIYVDNDGGFEKPFIKKSLNYFENAKKHFDEYDYPACANYLRKEVEKIKEIKDKQEHSFHNENKIFKKLKKMLIQFDLTDESKSAEIRGKLMGFKKGLEKDASVEIDLKDIRSITDRILNPQSHDDNSKPLYKKELEEAIDVINYLRKNLENPVE